jgi:hypothetical protein
MNKSCKHRILDTSPTSVQTVSEDRLSKKRPLDTSVGEILWLRDHRHTIVKKPAVRERVNAQAVHLTLPQARVVHLGGFFQDARRPPQLVPLFPAGNYTPNSQCGHYEPIERGSVFCCMVCHASGQDDHPALRKNCSVKLNSKVGREATFRGKNSNQRISLETRKQRRQRLFSAILNSPRAYF